MTNPVEGTLCTLAQVKEQAVTLDGKGHMGRTINARLAMHVRDAYLAADAPVLAEEQHALPPAVSSFGALLGRQVVPVVKTAKKSFLESCSATVGPVEGVVEPASRPGHGLRTYFERV